MKTRFSALLGPALIALTFASSASAAQAVPVSIQENGKTFKGDLYVPEGRKDALPLVLVIHEWWGKNDYPGARAKQIADELGFAALAVDLFGEARAVDTPQDAQKLASPFYQNPETAVARLNKFVKAAPGAAQKASASLDLSRTAAVGFCFGGSQALNLARSGDLPGKAELKSVVSFHGGLKSALEAKKPIEAKVLVLHGADDPMVKPEEVEAFKKEMTQSKADLKFIAYEGATHAFTNPRATEVGKKHNIPVAYHEEAAKASWKEMKDFLKSTLSKR